MIIACRSFAYTMPTCAEITAHILELARTLNDKSQSKAYIFPHLSDHTSTQNAMLKNYVW